MKEWIKADGPVDVAHFYNEKYRAGGYEAFSAGRERGAFLEMLRMNNGAFSKDRALFDAACGHGEFLDAALPYLTCAGCDISTEAVMLAVQRFGAAAQVFVCDMENLPCWLFSGFDYVTCFGSIEHTFDPKAAFHKLIRLLRPGGVLLLTVPLEFEGCLEPIAAEPFDRNNERFGTEEEWKNLFGQQPVLAEKTLGERPDLALLYRR